MFYLLINLKTAFALLLWRLNKFIFSYLLFQNASVPKGSHVILLGLADGTVLYDALHERYHPIGRVNKDVKYPDFYDYFNCLKVFTFLMKSILLAVILFSLFITTCVF